MKNFIFVIIFILSPLNHLKSEWKPQQVVIWGHKLHSHTHSYIHWGFYRAFKYLGYKTLWLDDQDKISGINFAQTLFLTEGQVDKKIPIRDDCFYVLHYPRDIKKYEYLFDKNQAIYLDRVLSHNRKNFTEKINDYCFANSQNKTIYIYWATDLFPDEIEENKKRIIKENNSKIINWIGTLSAAYYPDGKYDTNQNMSEVEPFFKAAQKNNITTKRFIQNLDMKKHIDKIRSSYLAPAIQGPLQCQQEYIPCRIFKNISYGHLGVTNSPAVYEFFQKKIVFNKNSYQLFFDAQKALKETSYEDRVALMDFVKKHHTYLNRIQEILSFIQLVNKN